MTELTLVPANSAAPIEVAAKSVYGKVHYYVLGNAKGALVRLTGKKTLDKADIEALRALGLQVKVTELPV